MILDKDGKIGGKLNILDLLVIIIVIVVIAGAGIKYRSKLTAAVKTNKNFEYVVKVNGVRQYAVDALKKGGKITDKKSEKDLGQIKDVKVEPAEMDSTTADGRVVKTPLPEKYTCYVTIEAKGKESDEGYILPDSTALSVGRTTDLYSTYCKTSGTIQSVKLLD